MQEHWLTSHCLFRINSVAVDSVCFNMSGMDDAISGGVLVAKPYGSLSILVHNNLAGQAKLVAVSLDVILLINVYLPNCDNNEEYQSHFMDILCAICKIIDQHSNNMVVIGGDFNSVFCESQ